MWWWEGRCGSGVLEVVREVIKCPTKHIPCQGGESESEVDAIV
jgi:hypothetical protein